MCVCVCAYQGPEPAFFTMDVPALDGGEWHRVGVLDTERQGKRQNEMTPNLKDTHTCQLTTTKTTLYIP